MVSAVPPRVPAPLELLSVEQLLALRPADWLVTGLLPKSSFAVLYGASGTFKTFIALDLALSVAAGLEWHGKAVSRGSVVYVAAEGGASIQKRVQAWMCEYPSAHLDTANFVNSPVNLFDPSPDALLPLLTALDQALLKPALIVFDTFARCFVGGEENSAQDVGIAVHNVGRLIEATEATVLLVHHMGKDPSGGERGSSALRGAADVMLRTEQKAQFSVRLKNDKMKDDEECPHLQLHLEPVTFDLSGERLSSLVVTDSRDAARDRGDGDSEPLSARMAMLLRCWKMTPSDELPLAELLQLTGRAKRTVQAYLREAQDLGLVSKVKPGRYRMLLAGTTALGVVGGEGHHAGS